MPTQATIAITPGTGQLLDAVSLVIGGSTVVRETMVIADPTSGTQLAGVTPGGALQVDASSTVQPVSGTITANIGTTNGLALNVTLTNGTQLAQPYDGAHTIFTNIHPGFIQGDAVASPQTINPVVVAGVDPTNNVRNLPVNLTGGAQAGTYALLIAGIGGGNDTNLLPVSLDGTSSAASGLNISGRYRTTQPTYTNNQAAQVQSTVRGALIVAPGVEGFAVTVASTTITGTVAVTQSTTPWVMSTPDNASVNIDQWGGTDVGAPTNFGTTPGAVIVGSVNASLFQGTVAVGAGAPLQVSLANTGANATAILVNQPTAANLNATVVGTGTFAVQATLAAETTKVIGTVNQGTTPWTVAGDSASGAANAGNPVKIGGVFNTTQPTVTTGQTVDAQTTARGAQIVATGVDVFTVGGFGPAFSTASWSSATPNNTSLTIPCANCSSVILSIINSGGTFSAGAITFFQEVAGAGFSRIIGQRQSNNSNTAMFDATAVYTLVSGETIIYQFPCSGISNLLVQLSPAIVGTGTVVLTGQAFYGTVAAPTTVGQSNAASLNATVVGTGTFVVQATLAAETTKVIGTVNQGTSPWVVSGAVTVASTTITGNVTVIGNKTNNSAVPGATNIGALVAVANVAPPVYIEGDEVLLSTDLLGYQRVAQKRIATIELDGAVFTVTSVANASGGNTVYTGTWTVTVTTTSYTGRNFVTSGFAQGANNGTFNCVAMTSTTLTLANPSGVVDTTGIATVGTVLTASQVFIGAWHDTVQEGTGYVDYTMFVDQNSLVAGVYIQTTDDLVSSVLVRQIPQPPIQVIAQTYTRIQTYINERYWRVIYKNNTTATQFNTLHTTSSAMPEYITDSSGNLIIVGTGTFAVQATLAAETTKVIGTIRIVGNVGATLDQANGSAVPTNGLMVGGGSIAGATNFTTLTVKAASVAAAATDTSLVVQPLVGSHTMNTAAAGTQLVGIVGNAAGVLDTAKGTQSATAIGVQELHDAGRNTRVFMLDAITAAPLVEALASVVQWYGNAAVATTTTPAVVPAGKTLRLLSWKIQYQSLATVGYAVVRVRINTAGVVALASPLAYSFEAGTNSGATTTAVTGAVTTASGDFPEGFEIPAAAGVGFTIAGYGPTGTLTLEGGVRFAVFGYEY